MSIATVGKSRIAEVNAVDWPFVLADSLATG